MYIMLIILLMDVFSGFTLVGNTRLKCRKGVWSSSLPTCTGIFVKSVYLLKMTVLFITFTSIITIIMTTKTMTKTTLSYGQVRSK